MELNLRNGLDLQINIYEVLQELQTSGLTHLGNKTNERIDIFLDADKNNSRTESSVQSNMETLRRSSHDWQLTKSSVRDRFKELLQLSLWTDCTFSIGEETIEVIRCHKLVLAVSSPVFEAHFFGGLSKLDEVIEVPDIEPHIFKLFLGYIYSDSVELKTIADAGGLLYVAKKYLMPQLAEICLEFLMENTCLKTLEDVLTVAELLNEEELRSVCLRVMSRYHFSLWYHDSFHLSKTMLMRLLAQKRVSMTEIELWDLVQIWGFRDCEMKGMDATPMNVRTCLDRSGTLACIRFLCFGPYEFSNKVKESGILTEEECRVFESIQSQPGAGLAVPYGFTAVAEERLTDKPVTWKCYRDVIRGNRFLCSGKVVTGITCSSRVLISGFEVVTRIANGPRKNLLTDQFQVTYREKLVVFIEDEDKTVISKTHHEAQATFDYQQIVNLSRPIWLEPGRLYRVEFDLFSGQYPLNFCTDTSLAKGTLFKFDDDKHMRGGSFIVAVLYYI